MKEILELEKRIKQARVDFIKENFSAYRDCTDEDCLIFYTCLAVAEKEKEKGSI